MKASNKQGILILAAVVFGIGAVILGILGWQQWSLFSQGKETPQRIKLADLAAKGPGDNIHLEITDFWLAERGYCELTEGGSWSRIWFAMEPLEAQDGAPVRVLFRSDSIKDQAGITAIQQQQPLRGILVNAIHSIDSDVGKGLKATYPSLNLDTALIFAHDWSYPKAATVYTYLGSAFGCLALCIGCSFGAYWVTLTPDLAPQYEPQPNQQHYGP